LAGKKDSRHCAVTAKPKAWWRVYEGSCGRHIGMLMFREWP